MTNSEIARRRLINQHLARPEFGEPGQEVAWLGAVQAQDYSGAKWALGQRLRGANDDAIERAFTVGSILRTHVMRPTWHFVTPADIRWMLALSAPRVQAVNAYMYRRLELGPDVLSRTNAAIERALEGGRHLARAELRGVLQRAGIPSDAPLRMGYILMRAELDGVICSGPRRGKQFTYALLEERVPPARPLDRDEALREIARRYLQSHGPATVQDFVWWSGLTTTDARRGLESLRSRLSHEVIDGRTYWFSPSATPEGGAATTAYLLPNYDEYGSYKDRSAAFDETTGIGDLIFAHMVAIDGRMVGTWKRTLTKHAVVIETNYFTPLTEREKHAVANAARRYSEFIGLPVKLS